MTRMILTFTLAYGAVLSVLFYFGALALGWSGPLAVLSAVVCGMALAWPTGPLLTHLFTRGRDGRARRDAPAPEIRRDEER